MKASSEAALRLIAAAVVCSASAAVYASAGSRQPASSGGRNAPAVQTSGTIAHIQEGGILR